MEYLIYISRPGLGREGQRRNEMSELIDALCSSLPPGLPHDDACFRDGDQWLLVSHWCNGGTIYIPGTTPESLQR